VGYPSHQWVGVYAADGATLLLKAGGSTPVSANQVLNLYMDTGNPDTPNNVVRAGDQFNVTLDNGASPRTFTGLQL
jgi:hypothetical protein